MVSSANPSAGAFTIICHMSAERTAHFYSTPSDKPRHTFTQSQKKIPEQRIARRLIKLSENKACIRANRRTGEWELSLEFTLRIRIHKVYPPPPKSSGCGTIEISFREEPR